VMLLIDVEEEASIDCDDVDDDDDRVLEFD
jgi:hypothetical protein